MAMQAAQGLGGEIQVRMHCMVHAPTQCDSIHVPHSREAFVPYISKAVQSLMYFKISSRIAGKRAYIAL